MRGLLSGIGFVGGGAIRNDKSYVRGTASAASIWITGALGAAIGFGLWWHALLLSLMDFLIIFVMSKWKEVVSDEFEDAKS